MADLRISQLPPLGAPALQADDVVAIVDLSASETKKITAKDLIQSSVALIDAGSIPGDKVTVTVPDGSIGTIQLADGSVTGVKLADNSSAIIASPLPPTGEFIGQLGVDNGDPSIWNGSIWLPFVGGLKDIQGGTVGPITTDVTIVGSSASVLAKVDDSAVPAAFVAGPTASAGAVELRPIVSADLPAADIDVAGVVSVPVGGGLTIDGGASGFGTDLVIDNDVAESAVAHVVTYSAKGLITSGRLIQSSDLPNATGTTPGTIYPGPEFNVSGSGELTLSNSVSPGTFPVITYNERGLVTSGRLLTSDDLPDFNADKITEGEITTQQLGDKSVTRPKLANYSTVYIQEVQPSIDTDDYIGVGWYQESTGQLRLYNGNSWMPVGFGRLSNDNLRWGGIVDAATGLVVGVTDSGTNAGLVIGDPIPAATNTLGGLYLVISEPGDQITVTPGVTYDAGDWVLCINEAEGWVRIDTMTGGGGGGGGASTLNDLLDVTVTGATDGQYLQLAGTGQWVNVDLNALEPGDNVSELVNDAGYVDQAEVINILDGKNPDGTPNPGAPDYITSDELTAAIGDGKISIQKADGTPVGDFTVNQAGDTVISLPADVVPSAPGDGQLTIKDADGNELGVFTANQATGTDTEITLPAAADPDGFVKLDDEGAQQTITGGGGLLVQGDVEVAAGGQSIKLEDGIVSASSGVIAPAVEATTLMTSPWVKATATGFEGSQMVLTGGATVAFGTDTAQLGNVMPRDDWSSIPARIPGGGGSSPTITLTSQSFNNGDAIGQQYYFNQNGCPGSNDNPELTWTFNDLPAGGEIVRYQIRCVDTDAGNFVHWDVSNIDKDQSSIAVGGSWVGSANVNNTNWSPTPVRANGWGGPCPPPGQTHTYSITITAQYRNTGGTLLLVTSDPLTFTASGS